MSDTIRLLIDGLEHSGARGRKLVGEAGAGRVVMATLWPVVCALPQNGKDGPDSSDLLRQTDSPKRDQSLSFGFLL